MSRATRPAGPRRIVVTGASSGIGHACALRCAQLGHAVWAGVRRPEDAEQLRVQAEGRLVPLLLDVTREESIAAARASWGDEPLDGLVNNAGIAVPGPLELVPVADFRRELEVNVIGLLAVTQAFLPALRRAGGRIVNVGSIAGRVVLPGSGAYDASKFAVEALTDALRLELAGQGVAVTVVEPGSVRSEIWRKGGAALEATERAATSEARALYQKLLDRVRSEMAQGAGSGIAPDEVARVVEHALTARRPRTRYLVGSEAKLLALLNLLPDRWRDRLILGRI